MCKVMGNKKLIVWIGLLAGAVVLMGGAGQDQGTESSRSGYEAALRSLSPERPEGYLQLGELMLLGPTDTGDVDFAVGLLVRGAVHGAQHGDRKTASSACIALTEHVDNEPTRRWLWDLALLLDPSREREWERMLEIRDEQRAAVTLEASRCLHSVRYHQHPESEEMYGKREVRDRILEAGQSVGIEWAALNSLIEREIQNGASDSCRGRLYVVDRDQRDLRRACPDHLRGLGMCANDTELAVLLRVEMVLAGVEASTEAGLSSGGWATSAGMGMDGAVKVPAVEDLEGIFRVRADRAFYRDGRWTATR